MKKVNSKYSLIFAKQFFVATATNYNLIYYNGKWQAQEMLGACAVHARAITALALSCPFVKITKIENTLIK